MVTMVEPQSGHSSCHLLDPLSPARAANYFAATTIEAKIFVSTDEKQVFAGPFGQLTPCGGGDPIPLAKERVMIGRRSEADIQLKFSNVSTQHCRLTLEHGYWFVRDLNSRNGTKVDDRAAIRKRIDPASKLSIAKHHFIVEYDPQSLGAYGPPPADDDCVDEMLRSSLMDRAGLQKRDGYNRSANRKPS